MNLTPKTPTSRYTDRIFPQYRFVPGESPHPARDPGGHSYKKPLEQLASFDNNQWQSCNAYLYGIDLFNYGYWWEAHEVLEAVWVAAGRQTQTGMFIQGLIQVAVAHLKKCQGRNDIAKHMASAGLEKMKHIQGTYLGIEVSTFRGAVESYFLGDNEMPVIIELITNS